MTKQPAKPHNAVQAAPSYIAAIDLGTRNCRLLISKKTGTGLEKIEGTSRFVCLGEKISKTHTLSPDAMDRAVTNLGLFLKKISHYDNITYMAVTTDATRRAKNSDAFLNRVHRELDLDLRVISSEEEAYYATLGCAERVDEKYNNVIIFDIGGGSTEVIFADFSAPDCPRIRESISIPLGVVSLAEDLAHKTFKKYAQIVDQVLSYTEPFCQKYHIPDLIEQNSVQLIGTSGTITTISALHQNLKFYDRDKVDGSVLHFEDIDKTIKHIQLMSPEERLLHPCIGQARDDLILGGLAIFEGIYRAFPNLPVTVTDRGVRDGIVYALAYPERLSTLPLATLPS